MVSRYGERPAVYTSSFPRSYWQAWDAEDEDYGRIRQIRSDLGNASSRISSYEEEFYGDKNSRIFALRAKLANLRNEIETNEDLLLQTKSASFYLSDFTPDALQISLAGPSGEFEIENPKAGEKVFAKLNLPDSTNSYFWLTDLPPNGQKLILSNGNLFSPPL